MSNKTLDPKRYKDFLFLIRNTKTNKKKEVFITYEMEDEDSEEGDLTPMAPPVKIGDTLKLILPNRQVLFTIIQDIDQTDYGEFDIMVDKNIALEQLPVGTQVWGYLSEIEFKGRG